MTAPWPVEYSGSSSAGSSSAESQQVRHSSPFIQTPEQTICETTENPMLRLEVLLTLSTQWIVLDGNAFASCYTGHKQIFNSAHRCDAHPQHTPWGKCSEPLRIQSYIRPWQPQHQEQRNVMQCHALGRRRQRMARLRRKRLRASPACQRC